jgi:hypothetical protein
VHSKLDDPIPHCNYYPHKSVILSRTGTPDFEDNVRLQQPFIRIFPICLLLAISPQAQQNHSPQGPPPTLQNDPPRVTSPNTPDEAQQRQAREMAKKANLQRQAAIKADTDKLLQLAVELKDSVDKSNENLLSLDVLKKAEQIEKLAHSVKDKMKGPS